jgi:hypothetical protein
VTIKQERGGLRTTATHGSEFIWIFSSELYTINVYPSDRECVVAGDRNAPPLETSEMLYTHGRSAKCIFMIIRHDNIASPMGILLK